MWMPAQTRRCRLFDQVRRSASGTSPSPGQRYPPHPVLVFLRRQMPGAGPRAAHKSARKRLARRVTRFAVECVDFATFLTRQLHDDVAAAPKP